MGLSLYLDGCVRGVRDDLASFRIAWRGTHVLKRHGSIKLLNKSGYQYRNDIGVKKAEIDMH